MATMRYSMFLAKLCPRSLLCLKSDYKIGVQTGICFLAGVGVDLTAPVTVWHLPASVVAHPMGVTVIGSDVGGHQCSIDVNVIAVGHRAIGAGVALIALPQIVDGAGVAMAGDALAVAPLVKATEMTDITELLLGAKLKNGLSRHT